MQSRKMVVLMIILLFIITALTACGQGNTGQSNDLSQKSALGNNESDRSQEGTADKNDQGDKNNDEKRYDGQVVVVVPQDPDYLDPHVAVASGTSEMMFNVFEGLLKPDNHGNLYPAVAEDYTVSDDGLTYTFKLRNGILFHNGQPVTVDDVKYTLERLMGVGAEKPLVSAFSVVDHVDIIDFETIQIVLKKFDASFLSQLTIAVLPKDNDDHNKHPIGTGPFKFVEYVPEQRLVIEKFKDYWDKEKPYLDRVEFRIIPDRETAFLSLTTGEIDMYPRIGVEKVKELGSDFYTVEGMQNMVQLMAMNLERKPFDQLNVRQAINYAINKDEIIQVVAEGYGTKLGSNMSPVMEKYYQDGLQDVYQTDLEKAKTLLKVAGYPDGFTTTITVPSNYQFHVDTAQVIASQLAKIGIKTKIDTVEWGVWLDRVYKGHDYDMTIIGLTGKLDPHQVLVRYRSDNPGNFFNYKSEGYDQLMDEAAVEVNDDHRAEIYKEAQKKLVDDAVAVYIMDPNFVVALKKVLKGYTLYPLYVQDMSSIYYTK